MGQIPICIGKCLGIMWVCQSAILGAFVSIMEYWEHPTSLILLNGALGGIPVKIRQNFDDNMPFRTWVKYNIFNDCYCLLICKCLRFYQKNMFVKTS